MKIFKVLFLLLKSFNFKSFKLTRGNCPLCGNTIFFRYNFDKWSVRCVKCGAAANSMALVSVLKNEVEGWQNLSVYVNSASGPYFSFLKKNCKSLYNSLYIENVERGEYNNNVQCQDLQDLTFNDSVFDVCTSAEIFEHIPDDKKAFKEIFRVLKPGGIIIFTVPFDDIEDTIERAINNNGIIEYLKEPVYHNDSIRGGKVLCYRDYGRDIIKRLSDVGFIDNQIITPNDPTKMGYKNPVIFGRKSIN